MDYLAIASYGAYPTVGVTTVERAGLAVTFGLYKTLAAASTSFTMYVWRRTA